jgi:hypothetical protein
MVTRTAALLLHDLSRATPEHVDAGGVGLAHGPAAAYNLRISRPGRAHRARAAPVLVTEHRRRPLVIRACTSDLGLPGGIRLSVPSFGL